MAECTSAHACNGPLPILTDTRRLLQGVPSDGQAQTEAPPCLTQRQPREQGGKGSSARRGEALLNRATHRPTGLKSGGARVQALHGCWGSGGWYGCGSLLDPGWMDARGPCLVQDLTCLSRRIDGCVWVDGWMMEGWRAGCLVDGQQHDQ